MCICKISQNIVSGLYIGMQEQGIKHFYQIYVKNMFGHLKEVDNKGAFSYCDYCRVAFYTYFLYWGMLI